MPKRWAIVLHGGCSNNCPDANTQQEIQTNLAAILEVALSALREGATARDVVIRAISTLEDCPLFNAGKGAAHTIEGDYELEAALVDGYSSLYDEAKLMEHFEGVVWLTKMDHLSVPFYQAYTDDSGRKARCADLLLGNGEVLGLGERHMLSDNVRAALRQHEVPAEPYE